MAPGGTVRRYGRNNESLGATTVNVALASGHTFSVTIRLDVVDGDMAMWMRATRSAVRQATSCALRLVLNPPRCGCSRLPVTGSLPSETRNCHQSLCFQYTGYRLAEKALVRY
jgi:hypothetical protein